MTLALPEHRTPVDDFEGEPPNLDLFALGTAGDVTIGGRRLKTGDYLYTPPNEAHDAVAHAETVLLLHAPKLPVFL